MVILAYLANVVIVATYWAITMRGVHKVWFDAANAICCVPLLAYAFTQEAWALMPITATFGLVGLLGALKHVLVEPPMVRHSDFRGMK